MVRGPRLSFRASAAGEGWAPRAAAVDWMPPLARGRRGHSAVHHDALCRGDSTCFHDCRAPFRGASRRSRCDTVGGRTRGLVHASLPSSVPGAGHGRGGAGVSSHASRGSSAAGGGTAGKSPKTVPPKVLPRRVTQSAVVSVLVWLSEQWSKSPIFRFLAWSKSQIFPILWLLWGILEVVLLRHGASSSSS